ncbi:hypothetical protein SOVF_038500 isoform B [Spinacia oleracea]|nr:hypothetical protein SOVF_038500 isoform B [Spinacia oleracea]
MKENFWKLDADVISSMCFDWGRDKRLASTHFGEVLYGVIKALDSEKVSLTSSAGMAIDGNPQEAGYLDLEYILSHQLTEKSDVYRMRTLDLYDILAPQVVKYGRKESILANLAKKCLNMDGQQRPTIREVLLQLEVIGQLEDGTV